MGPLPWTATVAAERLAFDGKSLLGLSPRRRRAIIGKDMAMIFQEATSSLNPCFTVGFQIGEALKVHLGLNKSERRQRTIELLNAVGISDPERRLNAFPHLLSGGMNQRVMIAMALACNPKLVIADEPTTALDVTIQAQILDLLLDLQKETGMALVLITHDMGVVAETAERVAVFYAGQKVEEQDVGPLFADPHHPYTAALLDSLPERAVGRKLRSIGGVVPGVFDRPEGCLFSPRCRFATSTCVEFVPPRQSGEKGLALCHYPLDHGRPEGHPGPRRRGGRMTAPAEPDILMRVENLRQHYEVRRGALAKPWLLKAVDGVSFTLATGSTLAVVGESGCGKSTLARMIAMVERPTSGDFFIDGTPLSHAGRRMLRAMRSQVQMVFQDPYGSLNPRQKVGSILEEPLKINQPDMPAVARRQAAIQIMERVGLRREHYERYPHMFSGGQRQRIAIARALMLRPRILVLDEPVSALDLSVQAQVLNILVDLQQEFGLAYLFISHSLSVVRHMADDVMVMYLGRAVECGPRDAIFGNPRHPYTRALLSATPVADPASHKERIRLEGELPSPINPPSGCVFHPRCPCALERCFRERPDLERKGGAAVACWAVDAAGHLSRQVEAVSA